MTVKTSYSCFDQINTVMVKSNQITFIVTSPQHKCLGEWNSYERAPDSAEKQQTIYIWTDSAKKTTNNLHMDRQCKKNNKQFTYGQTVQKTALEHLQCSRQCKKNNNSNLHMDRQCKKKQQQQFTYGQTVQKKTTAIYIWTDSAKKTTAIYIWTVHIYIFLVSIRDFFQKINDQPQT